MKKHLTIFAVVLLAIAIAAPAFAAVEFKYGGAFRARYFAQNNIFDGTENAFPLSNNPAAVQPYNGDDKRNILDYRLRLFFSFIASKNLKLVTAFEVGDAIFGQGGNPLAGSTGGANFGHNEGANVGGDSVAVEVKSAYIEFNIPNTPSTGIVGLQPLKLLDSWIVDDDLPAAVLTTKLDPFRITVGYVGGQNGWERRFNTNELPTTDQAYNVDDVFLALDFVSGPWKANLSFFFQDGHDSVASLDPASMFTPVRNFTGAPSSFSLPQFGFGNGIPSFGFLNGVRAASDNFLFDLGLNVTYKTDYLLAYVNFVKNFGSVDLLATPNAQVNAAGAQVINGVPTIARTPTNAALGLPGAGGNVPISSVSADYQGWMVDAGFTYYCGPYTFNVGGFYTSGPDISKNPAIFATGVDPATVGLTNQPLPFRNLTSKNVEWFTQPLGTSKAFSEIIGGGILGEDLHIVRGYPGNLAGSSVGNPAALNTVFWRGYYNPTNLWTLTAGASWQVLEKTKISASYWYFGTSEDVPVRWNPANPAVPNVITGLDTFKMSTDIGHELNFYLDQGIVDGLTLTLVGAYLFAGDAFAPISTTGITNMPVRSFNPLNGQVLSRGFSAEDAYEVGARLQWVF